MAGICLLIALCTSFSNLMAQESTTGTKKKSSIKKTEVQDTTATNTAAKKKQYVKNTFEGNYIIDNQTVMVPIKGTFEFDIQHRFATINYGFKDLFGLFNGANMRLGFSYVPFKDLQIGFGASNENMQLDLNLKYAILKQTKDGSMPVSITYFGNVLMDPRGNDSTTLLANTSDRFSFFNQIIIARKISEKFSLQVSPSFSHINNLERFYAASGQDNPKWSNNQFAISVSGRYKISDVSSIIINYDQPLSQHASDNPRPNISFGIEMKTSGHDFEIFFGNYGSTSPEYNSLLNQNDFTKQQFLIGFNISRLWNF